MSDYDEGYGAGLDKGREEERKRSQILVEVLGKIEGEHSYDGRMAKKALDKYKKS